MANSTLRFVDTAQVSPVDITVRADRTSDGATTAELISWPRTVTVPNV